MLVRFSSIKTEPITMFGETAVQLIKMLGASGHVPGALTAEDIPAAVARLQQQLHVHTAADTASNESADDDDEDRQREPPVALATRAMPLIDLLQRAAAGNAPLMWEAV